MKETPPCKQCPCIAICKHMYFIDMKNKCSLINDYLFNPVVDSNHVFERRRPDFDERIYEAFKILKPQYWRVGKRDVIEHGYVHTFSYKQRAKKKAAGTRVAYFHYSGPAE